VLVPKRVCRHQILAFHSPVPSMAAVSTSTQTKRVFINPSRSRPSHRLPAFVTTHWSIVLTAGRCDTPRAKRGSVQNFARLIGIRFTLMSVGGDIPGKTPRNFTQEFFARLLETELGRQRPIAKKGRSDPSCSLP